MLTRAAVGARACLGGAGGPDGAVEVAMPVREQEEALRQIRQWVQADARRFQPGAWYFAGQLLAG